MSAKGSNLLDGHRVAKARAAKKRPDGKSFSQQDLADEIGSHRVTIARIENNDQRVSLELLERLCLALDRTREHLLGLPETIDEFDLAREHLARSLVEFSEAIDLIRGRVHSTAAKPRGRVTA